MQADEFVKFNISLWISRKYPLQSPKKREGFQFSKIKRDSNSGEMRVYEPGLHFKIPLIEDVNVTSTNSPEKRRKKILNAWNPLKEMLKYSSYNLWRKPI